MSPSTFTVAEAAARIAATLGLLAWATLSQPPEALEAAVIVGLVGYWLGEGVSCARRRATGALYRRPGHDRRRPHGR
jgi:hypothetical protein